MIQVIQAIKLRGIRNDIAKANLFASISRGAPNICVIGGFTGFVVLQVCIVLFSNFVMGLHFFFFFWWGRMKRFTFKIY